MSIPIFTLNNGVKIPSVGLGTYRVQAQSLIESAITSAIISGYRLIDSAIAYKNEKAIGNVLTRLFDDSSSNVKREDVFLTSKLPPKDQGYDSCINAFNTSLENFGTTYLDLFLIHWPGTQKLPLASPENAQNRLSSYRALETLYNQKKVRAIGVSNYTPRHLTELLSHCTVIPAVLQIEMHPLLYQPDLINLCNKHGIRIQAYSSLGEGKLVNGEMDISILDEISQKYGVTKAQVLLRWANQHDAVVIPKSVTSKWIRENINLFQFELNEEDMAALDSLTRTNRKRFCWDPTDVF